jgi:predicted dehydrogenase
MKHRSNRRDFLKQTTLAGAGFWVAGGLSLAAPGKSANGKLNFACVGVGGKGDSDSAHVADLGVVVAICDVDDNALNNKDKDDRFAHAKKYHDFRKMLHDLGDKIDAVTVSTADHTHAPASIMAMKMGKHVYCQKPLTHTVYEARQMREIAAKHKVATQMGNQGTADSGFRRAVEVIRSGAIGPVHEVHVWTNRPTGFWKQAPDVMARPKETPPVPKNVHWDLFLGPAPERPYNPIYHPFAWRGWWDFGTGALGDMACHTANMAFMALKLGYPTSVKADAGDLNSETYPSWAIIQFEFPARGDLPPVKLTWYEGKKNGNRVLPPAELTHGHKIVDSGSILVGEKGVLYSPNDYGSSYVLLPEKNFEGYKPPEPTLPRNPRGGDEGQKAEWVAAIRGGPPALSNFNYAALLTETILLGNVAMRVGKRMEWDGENMRSPNCPDAAKYVRTEYRKGWEL